MKKNTNNLIFFLVFILITLYFISWQKIRFWLDPSPERTVEANESPLKMLWEYYSEEPFSTPPLGDKNTVIIPVNNGEILAFESSSSEITWRYEITQFTSNSSYIALSENVVVSSSNNGPQTELFALDSLNGDERWNVPIAERLTQSPHVLVVDDFIIVAQRSMGGTFVAGYEFLSGKQLWKTPSFFPLTGFTGMFNCSATYFDIGQLDNSDLACILFGEDLYVVMPENGHLFGHQFLPFSPYNNLTFENGLLFASSIAEKSTIQIFDVRTQAEIVVPIACRSENFAFPVFTFQDQLLVSNGCNELYVLRLGDLSSAPQWIYRSPRTVASSFVTLDGSIGYFLDESGFISAIDLETGKLVGGISISPNTEMHNRKHANGLFVLSNYLFVILDENNLFVYSN